MHEIKIKKNIKASKILEQLDIKINLMQDFCIEKVNSINFLKNNCISFFNKKILMEQINDVLSIVFVKDNFSYDKKVKNIIFIKCKNPKLYFAKTKQILFPRIIKNDIHKTAVIEDNAIIGKNVIIGANSYIGNNVVIGSNTHVSSGAVIEHSVVGEYCNIDGNAVIGSTGFGFVPNKGKHYLIPHTGKVIIGNFVNIGSLCSIDRGTNEDTVLKDMVQLDSGTHIGHNVFIGTGSVIAGKGVVGGSSKIGDFVTCGGRVSISNGVKIGNNSVIGGGSSLLKDVKENEFYAGAFPAMNIKKWLSFIKKLNKL